MIVVKRYSEDNKELWDNFITSSKKNLFMFCRDYMDYHKDRFDDNSLMFFNLNELIACFPACKKDNLLMSHGGLTYGGMITNEKMKQHIMNDCFIELINYCKNNNIEKVIWKMIPFFYYKYPSDEEKYSLYINGGYIKKIEVSTLVDLKNQLKIPKSRKSQISRAKNSGVVISEAFSEEEFRDFMQLENNLLSVKYDTKAVHSFKELKLLKDYFPSNIHLFVAKKETEIIAGSVIYEYDNVIHTQYMATNEIAREIGALDLVITYIINLYKDEKKWLDFGISTENNGLHLNIGLIHQKESFGGRSATYDTWELPI